MLSLSLSLSPHWGDHIAFLVLLYRHYELVSKLLWGRYVGCCGLRFVCRWVTVQFCLIMSLTFPVFGGRQIKPELKTWFCRRKFNKTPDISIKSEVFEVVPLKQLINYGELTFCCLCHRFWSCTAQSNLNLSYACLLQYFPWPYIPQ